MSLEVPRPTVLPLLAGPFLALAIFSNPAQADNKVVVIPMAGEVLPARLDPSSLIPADHTNSADYTSTNGVTLDKVTGLEWQQEYSSSDFTYPSARINCLALELDGKTDWRLPAVKELLSIVNFGTSNPAINDAGFPATEPLLYWATTDINTNANKRWGVGFGLGSSESADETSSHKARCVRSTGSNSLVQLFKDTGYGSVTDLANGLIWQQQDDNVQRNHSDAMTYCQNLVLTGSNNWRLPEVKELVSIVDFRAYIPVIDEQLFPATNSAFYWTATSGADNPASAWAINFSFGLVSSPNTTNSNYVRCVR